MEFISFLRSKQKDFPDFLAFFRPIHAEEIQNSCLSFHQKPAYLFVKVTSFVDKPRQFPEKDLFSCRFCSGNSFLRVSRKDDSRSICSFSFKNPVFSAYAICESVFHFCQSFFKCMGSIIYFQTGFLNT